MKKSEVIQRRNRLKQVSNYRYLQFAKYASVLMILLFIAYVGILGNAGGVGYEQLLSDDPLVITGFMICTANLYVWWVLKHFCIDLPQLEHIESIRVNLMVLALCQFFLMNFISAILMVISLVKYFRWDRFSWKKSLRELKQDGQLPVLAVTLAVMMVFIALVFGIFFSIRGAM